MKSPSIILKLQAKLAVKLQLLALVIMPAISLSTQAQTQEEKILLPIHQQGQYLGNITTPAKGLSRATVLERFGVANKTTPATGTPPISRWEYSDFSVYFESDVVIHTVLKHRPLQPSPPRN